MDSTEGKLRVLMLTVPYDMNQMFNFSIQISISIQQLQLIIFNGMIGPSRPGPPHYRGFMITVTKTHHTWQGFSGWVISPTQRPVRDKTQHSQQTSMHQAGFETAIPATERPSDPLLRPHDHRDQLTINNNVLNAESYYHSTSQVTGTPFSSSRLFTEFKSRVILHDTPL
jgi:hypothetical protein